MSLAEMEQADLGFFYSEFGEAVSYQPAGSSAIEISAIVNRSDKHTPALSARQCVVPVRMSDVSEIGGQDKITIGTEQFYVYEKAGIQGGRFEWIVPVYNKPRAGGHRR